MEAMAMWLLTITIATWRTQRWCIHWASTPIDSHCPGREYFQVSFVSRTSWVILTNCQRLWTDLPGQEHKGDLAQNYSLYYHFNLCLPLNGPEQRVALEVLIWQASSSTITWSTVCYEKVGLLWCNVISSRHKYATPGNLKKNMAPGWALKCSKHI